VALAHDGASIARSREHDVDHPASRWHRDLRLATPRGVPNAQQRFDDRRLESIVDSWSSTKEEANPEIAAEAGTDCLEDIHARPDSARLDSPQMRWVDVGAACQLGLRDAGLRSQVRDLLADPRAKLPYATGELSCANRLHWVFAELRSCRVH
jgi:hypothetical protein